LVVTLHRPSNVDEAEGLKHLGALGRLARSRCSPVHPRARGRIAEFRLEPLVARHPGIRLIDPLGYLDFLRLLDDAELVVTDSGGIQEETTVLDVPCLTVRPNTERPVTVTEGTNLLIGTDPARIVEEGLKVLSGRRKSGRVPPLWDGHAAGIAAALKEWKPRRPPGWRPALGSLMCAALLAPHGPAPWIGASWKPRGSCRPPAPTTPPSPPACPTPSGTRCSPARPAAPVCWTAPAPPCCRKARSTRPPTAWVRAINCS
jgi:hypothetical protein